MESDKQSSRGVLGSLSAAVMRLRHNPNIFAGALVVTLLSGAIALLSFVDPIVANLSSIFWVFVWPFLIAGLLGIIFEARTERAQLTTLITSGKSHYLSMLGATLLFIVVLFAIAFLSFILAFVLLIGAVIGSAEGLLGGGLSLLLLVTIVPLFILPYILAYMFFQFYDTGIIVGGKSATSSISHSFGLVRQNFISVFGYTIIFFLIQAVGYGPGYALLFLGGAGITETGQLVITSGSLFVVGSLLTLIFGTLAMALAFTYHVTFYESLSSETDTLESTNGSDLTSSSP
jgi:hypothetical protein